MTNIIVYRAKVTHLSTYGLVLFLFLAPFEYPLADLMSVSPLRLVGILVIGLAIIDILLQKCRKIDYRFWGVLFWLFYGLVTFLWVSNVDRFQSYYSVYLNNAIMFLVLSIVNFTKKEAETLKRAMIWGVGVLLLYMTFVPEAVIYSQTHHRLTLNAGTEGLDQNYLAALMLMAFGMVFYKLCNEEQKKVHKVISAVFCAGIVCYVILTGSRSGVLAVVFIMLICINSSWKKRLCIGIPVLLVLIIGVSLLRQNLPEEFLERFSISALTGNEAESGTRLIIWQHALKSLKNFKWVFGYGVGASQTIIDNLMGRDYAIHNHYIAMLVEVGVLGFSCILYPMLRMTHIMWKKDKGVFTGFLGILIMTFFLDVVTTKFFWSAMILLSACCSAARNPRNSSIWEGQKEHDKKNEISNC